MIAAAVAPKSHTEWVDHLVKVLLLEGVPKPLAQKLAEGIADRDSLLAAAFRAGCRHTRALMTPEPVNQEPEYVPPYHHCRRCRLWLQHVQHYLNKAEALLKP